MEPKVRRLKGEDVEPKTEMSKDKKVVVQRSTPDQSVQVQLPEKSNTIKIGKTDLHVTYRDTTFFLLGLLCGVVL